MDERQKKLTKRDRARERETKKRVNLSEYSNIRNRVVIQCRESGRTGDES